MFLDAFVDVYQIVILANEIINTKIGQVRHTRQPFQQMYMVLHSLIQLLLIKR